MRSSLRNTRDIRRHNIDIFTVGSDWVGKFDYLNEYCTVVYLPRTEGISSTELRSVRASLRVGIVGELDFMVKFLRESEYVNGVEVCAICADDVAAAKEMFGEDTKIRLRPSYFPFTEPSAEMDISCNICGGKGCPFCKGTGWVEILGCGMVDPNVLELNGIDSKVYSGYALGMGIERITNLKYQVKDLRMFSENDVRFLKEFEAAN